MKSVLQVVLAFAIGVAMFFYYQLVLPAVAAAAIAVIIAVTIIVTMISGRFEMKAIGFGSASIAAWPLGALIAHAVAGVLGVALTDTQAASAAVFVACLAAMGAYTFAEKRDRARDIATISIAAICFYTIVYAIISKDNIAISLASFGVAAGALVLKQQLILPPKQEFALWVGAAIAGSVGITHAAAVGIARLIW